jgi:sterol 24-C-methyltransferase
VTTTANHTAAASSRSPARFLDRIRRPASTQAELVDAYYDAVTDFYEHGWGQSFHFAPRFEDETRRESLRRHEYHLALRLALEPGMRVIDLGCGIGGPMRNIARFADVDVTGITINAHQVRRCEQHNAAAGLGDRCRAIEGDFAAIPCEERAFDAGFALEALCHAADRHAVFAEVHRVLRPGALLAGYEWCLTERFDPTDAEHQELKRTIEDTIAIPALTDCGAVDGALRRAGFELLERADLAAHGDPSTPWYRPLTTAERGLQGIMISRPGRRVTHLITTVMEAVGRAPQGSRRVHEILMRSGDALARSGQLGIFTPAYFFLARKPD